MQINIAQLPDSTRNPHRQHLFAFFDDLYASDDTDFCAAKEFARMDWPAPLSKDDHEHYVMMVTHYTSWLATHEDADVCAQAPTWYNDYVWYHTLGQ